MVQLEKVAFSTENCWIYSAGFDVAKTGDSRIGFVGEPFVSHFKINFSSSFPLLM